MSSDEESFNNDPVVSANSDNELVLSDIEQTNETLQVLQDQDAQTEEVQRDGTAEGEEDGENVDGDKNTVKPKRVIRNPQPKLNEETLKGVRGIAALETYFQNKKFKGKGHEQQDLEVIMKTYEYWCHRLFPKFPFDTCIERLEKLGNKKAVQTHIKRIRFDLLIEDKPILDDSDEEPNVEGFIDIQNNQNNQQQNQQFDQLLGSSASAPVTSVDLTEEQLERIRLNKERAERLRQERLKKIRDKAEESLQVSSQLAGTSGLTNDTLLSESTQSDIFSQKDYTMNGKNTNVLEQIDHTEAIFDHESNVKGKTNSKGFRIKKKALKRTVFSSDSEKSDDDYCQDQVSHENASSTNGDLNHMESRNIGQNTSDNGFAQKKKNTKNTIYDSDNSEDEISTEKNVSTKKLIGSDESDQEMEEAC